MHLFLAIAIVNFIFSCPASEKDTLASIYKERSVPNRIFCSRGSRNPLHQSKPPPFQDFLEGRGWGVGGLAGKAKKHKPMGRWEKGPPPGNIVVFSTFLWQCEVGGVAA